MLQRSLKCVPQAVVAVAVAALFMGSSPGYVAAAQGPSVVNPRFDLTGNQLVNIVDAQVESEAWELAQDQPSCTPGSFSKRDLNGDGCVDVADVQLMASQMGNATNLNAPQLRFVGDASTLATATFTVDSNGNQDDATPGDGQCKTSAGTCTLRAALHEANNRPGPEQIKFNVRNADGSCPSVVTIKPTKNDAPPGSANPTDPDTWMGTFMLEDQGAPITIDGYTQCGAKPNTAATAGNAVIKIELDGGGIDTKCRDSRAPKGIDGIEIRSAGNTVRGLASFRWDHQMILVGGQTQFNHVEGNFLGTNAAQTFYFTKVW